MVAKRVKKYEKMMTHQIPSYLAFCTPGQNKKKKTKQGTNSETLKRNKHTQQQLHISQWISRNEKKWVTSNMKRSKESRHSWKSSKQPNHGKIVN